MGVPIVVHRKQIRLGTMRLQVRSLASLSGLRIQRCHELWCKSQMQLRSVVAVAVAEAVASSCSSNSAPSLGTSICLKCGLKRQKDQKKERNIKQDINFILMFGRNWYGIL